MPLDCHLSHKVTHRGCSSWPGTEEALWQTHSPADDTVWDVIWPRPLTTILSDPATALVGAGGGRHGADE